MNRKQLIAMWLGITITVSMLVVPPWKTGMGTYGRSYSRGYRLLFTPPRGAVGVDTGILAVQFLAIGLVAGGAIVSLKSKS